MAALCRENKGEVNMALWEYISNWEQSSKHIWVDSSQYKMQNFEYHKTTPEYSLVHSILKLLFTKIISLTVHLLIERNEHHQYQAMSRSIRKWLEIEFRRTKAEYIFFIPNQNIGFGLSTKFGPTGRIAILGTFSRLNCSLFAICYSYTLQI